MSGCDPGDVYDRAAVDVESPFMKIQLRPEQQPVLQTLLQRCVLLKSVIELYGEGTSVEQCAAQVQSLQQSGLDKYLRRSLSFSLEVHGYAKRMSMAEQASFRQNFHFLDFPGP
eukprot:scaffold7480_cov277-Pinguiococcus_pyrenoidosus.AAC.1